VRYLLKSLLFVVILYRHYAIKWRIWNIYAS